jgi:hypothetical protein
MKFYVVEDGQFVEKSGYCVLGKFHAIKLGKGNWVIYDSKSGLKVAEGLKTITACIAWVKSTDGVAAVDAVRGREDYASLTATMKEYRHAHKLVQTSGDKAEEVADVEPVEASTLGECCDKSCSTEDAVEVESTPISK